MRRRYGRQLLDEVGFPLTDCPDLDILRVGASEAVSMPGPVDMAVVKMVRPRLARANAKAIFCRSEVSRTSCDSEQMTPRSRPRAR